MHNVVIIQTTVSNIIIFLLHFTYFEGQCTTPSGVGVKLFYSLRQRQPFYQKLFQLPFDTDSCPIDMFLSLDANKDMNGLSFYSECIEVLYDSLLLQDLVHKIYIPLGNDSICNQPVNFTRRYPNQDRFGLIVHSSLKRTIPLDGVYFTLLQSTDTADVSIGFMKRSNGKVGLLHSVEVNVMESILTVPVTFEGSELAFTGSSKLFSRFGEFYEADLVGKANTVSVWERLTLELYVKFSKVPGRFLHRLNEEIYKDVERRAREAERRKEIADEQLDKSVDDFEQVRSALQDARESFNNATANYNSALQNRQLANNTLMEAETAVANKSQILDDAFDDICQIRDCPDQCVNITRTRTVYRDQYITALGVCESLCNVTVQVRVEPFSEPTTVWRFINCPVCISVPCGDNCLRKECKDRFLCKEINATKPVYNYKPQIVERTCYKSCNKTVYSNTIATTETYVDSCGQYVPEPACVASNEECENTRETMLSLVRRSRQELVDSVRQRNKARRELGIANVALSRALLMKAAAEDNFNTVKTQFDLAEIVANASRNTHAKVVNLIGNDLKLYQYMKKHSSVKIIDVTDISFNTTLRGLSPVVIPIDVMINSSLTGQQFLLRTLYNFNWDFQQQKNSLTNSIIDYILEQDNGTNRRRKRVTAVSMVEQSELDFQTRCAELVSITEFVQYLSDSLQGTLELSKERATSATEVLKLVDNLIQSTEDPPSTAADYEKLKEEFDLTQNEIDAEPPKTVDESVKEDLLNALGDVRNSTDKLIANINYTVFNQWRTAIGSLLTNEASIADRECYGLGDCVQVLTETLEELLSFAPSQVSGDLLSNLPSATENSLSIANTQNLTINEAITRLTPMEDLVNTMNNTGYWCASSPTIITHPVNEANISVGTSLVLNCLGESTLPLTYQWRRDGVIIPGASSPTLKLRDFQVFNEGNYTCDISNDVSTIRSTNTSVHGYILPEFYLTPVSVVTYIGNENGALFTCNATSRPDPGWKWFFQRDGQEDWKEISGEETNELLILNPDSDNIGYYRCVVYNYHGNLSSDPVYLKLVSATSRVFAIPMKFTMNAVNRSALQIRTVAESIEDAIRRQLSTVVDLYSTSVERISVEYLSNGDVLEVSFTLVSGNANIGTMSLAEVVQKQSQFRNELNSVEDSIQRFFESNSFRISSDSKDYVSNSGSLIRSTFEIVCPEGQALTNDSYRFLCSKYSIFL